MYRDLDQLVADMDLVFINAKRYNMDESKLYKVCLLQRMVSVFFLVLYIMLCVGFNIEFWWVLL